MTRVLSSQWGSLSPHLMAAIYEVRMPASGDWSKPEKDDSVLVVAPVNDGEMAQTQNWNSPFENQTLDSGIGLHAFSAALQLGIGAKVANDLGRMVPPGLTQDALYGMGRAAGAVAGRTGITKLNSTQIYSGSPPMKMTLKLVFRALKDPTAEVKEPVAQLFLWSAPKRLAPYGLADLISGESGGDVVRTVYASEIPSLIGIVYQGCEYSPMVIESISKSMTSPVDQHGRTVFTTVELSLSSLSALDRTDWARALSVRSGAHRGAR